MKWEIDTKSVELLRPWKINGAEISSKELIIIKYSNGDYVGLGEVSYGSREKIDLSTLQEDLDNFYYDFKNEMIAQFSDLTRLLDNIHFEIPRLRFAIEAAYIDYLHRATEIDTWRIIGTNTVKRVNSVCSLPIFNSTQEIQELVDEVKHSNTLKLKISKESFKNQLDYINSTDYKIILDANESWGHDLKGLLESLSLITSKNVLFIEEPLKRGSLDLYKKLKEDSPIEIFLDESVGEHRHVENFKDLCHGLVIKSCKSLSHMRMVTQMTAAKKAGLKTMLGCMVESSLGISSLFTVAYGFDYYDFDGFTKLKTDPYGRAFWESGKVSLSSMN